MKNYNGKKRDIQSYFYKRSPTKSNIIALAGNNLDLHIEDFKHILTKKAVAYIYDTNKTVINKFKYLENKQLKLINDDLINCRIERFIDADLMCTLTSSMGILLYLLRKQWNKYNTYKDYYKTFMFTYCLRNNTIELNNFLQLIKLTISYHDISIEHKTYRDGSPMCTVQIIWK